MKGMTTNSEDVERLKQENKLMRIELQRMAVLASSNGFSSEMNSSRYAPLGADSHTLSPQ